MMDDRIRRAALRAAQKTAIIVSLSGCYDMHGRPLPAPTADAGAPIVADAAPTADAPTLVPDAGAPPLPCGELLPSLAITLPEPVDGAWAWGAHFTDERARLDATVGGCCMELEEAASVGAPLVETGAPLAMACCDVITSAQMLVPFSSLGCTPWGPPCPPEMPEEDEPATA